MKAAGNHHERGVAAKVRRVWALVKKEARQLVRDPSSIAIGIVLPLALILLFGYGMSLDVKHVPVAVVLALLSVVVHEKQPVEHHVPRESESDEEHHRLDAIELAADSRRFRQKVEERHTYERAGGKAED